MTEPHAPRRRLAEAVRRAACLAMESAAPDAVLLAAADRLERWCEQLAHGASTGSAALTPVFAEHSPVHGPSNPLSPPARLAVVDGLVRGSVIFGTPYQGPPGSVHGGMVAALFDDVLGVAQMTTERPGPTGSLLVRYHRPTPLHEELQVIAQVDRIDGRRIHARAELFCRDLACAEAEAVFIRPRPS